MSEALGVGYLALAEASRIAIRPGPNVVYLRLVRDFPAEHQTTCMFAEMTPGDALRLVRELQDSVRVALQHA